MLGFEISGLRLNRHAQTYQRPIGLELAFAPLALLRCALCHGVVRFVLAEVRDALYDAVAATRYRVFGTKTEACPLLPPALRQRFET